MNFHKLNVFFAWLLMAEVVAMGWIAFVGRMVLELLGVTTQEGDIPGRIVGFLLLLAVIASIQVWRGSLPPEGNAAGNGYRFGHRLLLAANVLALVLFGFEFVKHLMLDRAMASVIAKFTDAFGYWVLAMWAIGFSFLYQSAMPATAK